MEQKKGTTVQYTVDHFIDKFTAIPENKIIAGRFTDELDQTKHCALGHLGVDRARNTVEADAFRSLFDDIGERVMSVNDGTETRFKQPTPKQRVLAALRYIKEQHASNTNSS
jgi:hypothetical protein